MGCWYYRRSAFFFLGCLYATWLMTLRSWLPDYILLNAEFEPVPVLMEADLPSEHPWFAFKDTIVEAERLEESLADSWSQYFIDHSYEDPYFYSIVDRYVELADEVDSPSLITVIGEFFSGADAGPEDSYTDFVHAYEEELVKIYVPLLQSYENLRTVGSES